MLMQPKSSSFPKLYGFGIVKNGLKFDFPFRESVLSLKPLVEKVYYVLGDSSDNTNDEFIKLDFCTTENSNWDMSLKDGLVISIETNKALSLLRKSIDINNAWGIYLQADEVLHQDDYQVLMDDIARAEAEGFDAITFRYLHFWQSHHQIAISKNWYPWEIRAIKLESDIVSWGDGQSFKNCKKVLKSEARIFHYGHVREAASYEEKMRFQAAFHFKGIRYYRKRFETKRNHIKQRSITYYGTHPETMKERILRMKDVWELPEKKIVYIVGDKKDYSETLLNSINCSEIGWVNSLTQVPRQYRSSTVLTNPGPLDLLFRRTRVPSKMCSPLADDWNPDFKLTLQLSEKKIGLKNKT
jgi:hypothetical protein